MRKLLIAALLLGTSGANAGWLGPSDYRECVLNEMKGTAMSMLSTVKGLCNNKFPCPEPTPSEYAKCASESSIATPAAPLPHIGGYLPGEAAQEEALQRLFSISPKELGECQKSCLSRR